MDEWVDGWIGGWMDGWMNGWMKDGWMNGWMNGWMDGWMDVGIDGWKQYEAAFFLSFIQSLTHSFVRLFKISKELNL